jgi:uncharacterized protein YndB with AHSA1/START domain
MTSALPYSLDRSIDIQASPETVFRFFTDSDRWAAWWGAGSTIDAREGGKMYIRHPGNVESRGHVVEVDPGRKIVFTYGFVTGKPIPPGASRVTIVLERRGSGTRLSLTHEFPDQTSRDEHVQGWRFQLSLFANAIANAQMSNAAQIVDRWFGAWNDRDTATREAAFAEIAAPGIRMLDQFSCLAGIDDLLAHVTASQRFMPGIIIERLGGIRHCQWTVLADWKASGADGTARGSGTTVFRFGADGTIETVTGFWNAA